MAYWSNLEDRAASMLSVRGGLPDKGPDTAREASMYRENKVSARVMTT